MKHQRRSPAALATLLVTSVCGPSLAQVTFRGFGVNDAYINGMSTDGSVVVGVFVDKVRSGTAFRWTAAGGIEEIGGIMDAIYISRDGKTIVGAALDSQGIQSTAIWQGGKNWRTLGGVLGGVPAHASGNLRLSHPGGVSADGSVIVGAANVANSRTHGFRWDAVNLMVDLGALVRDESSYATGVSANGKAVVGWTRDPSLASRMGDPRCGVVFMDGIARLIHPYGWAGEAFASNDVGSTIVGRFPPQTTGTRHGATTWRWSAWNGVLEDLGAVWQGTPGSNIAEYQSQPTGLSDTGDVVVGVTGSFQRLAYNWTVDTGMVTVADYLTANGVASHKDWYLSTATYVSPDGKLIAGVGFNPKLIAESWIVTLP
jgi:probable HAF family extracellular repeat protein